jgi:hypothetical protein
MSTFCMIWAEAPMTFAPAPGNRRFFLLVHSAALGGFATLAIQSMGKIFGYFQNHTSLYY